MISTNPLLSKASGRLGILVVKQYGDKTVISARPNMSRRKLSPKQKELNERMSSAISLAKRLTANPVLKQRACSFLNVPANKVFRALVKEYLLTDGEGPVFKETAQEQQDSQTLQQLKETITQQAPDAQVIQFGEKKKDPAKPFNHWDLLVLTTDDQEPLSKWQLKEKLDTITLPLGQQVNLLMIQKEKWLNEHIYQELRQRIEKELAEIAKDTQGPDFNYLAAKHRIVQSQTRI